MRSRGGGQLGTGRYDCASSSARADRVTDSGGMRAGFEKINRVSNEGVEPMARVTPRYGTPATSKAAITMSCAASTARSIRLDRTFLSVARTPSLNAKYKNF